MLLKVCNTYVSNQWPYILIVGLVIIQSLHRTIDSHSLTFNWSIKLHTSTIQTKWQNSHRWPGLLFQMTFCQPCKVMKGQHSGWGPLKGINKVAWGVRCSKYLLRLVVWSGTILGISLAYWVHNLATFVYWEG